MFAFTMPGVMELLTILGMLAVIFVPAMIVLIVVLFAARRPKSNPNLIACSDCGRMVSRHADACPHCGRPATDNGDQTTLPHEMPEA